MARYHGLERPCSIHENRLPTFYHIELRTWVHSDTSKCKTKLQAIAIVMTENTVLEIEREEEEKEKNRRNKSIN